MNKIEKPAMSTRDIVVIGASAGGVEALKEVLSGLDRDFKGVIFIVLHTPRYVETQLPAILSNVGPLEAVLGTHQQEIEQGKIYIAPNNHHLLLQDGKIVITKDPKENRFRPSIDVLFRSAAVLYRSRVIGVVLSGALYDGTLGLLTIKQLGSIAIIQDPNDAKNPQMPINAMKHVQPDFILPATDMGSLLINLVKGK